MKALIYKWIPLIFIIGMPVIVQSQTVITTAGSATSCPGEITISVNVTGFAGVGAFSMVLNVNPSVVGYTGYQNLNSALSNGAFVANEQGGKIYLLWYGNAAATIPNGTSLIVLKFNGSVGTSAMAWDTQTPGNCEYVGFNGQILSSAWINGTATLYQSPVIISHPTDVLLYKGGNTIFSVSATGANLSWLWQVSINGGNSWTDLSDGGFYSNVTGSTLYINNAPLGLNGYRYRCKVSGSCLPVTYTNPALLTVVPFVTTTCQSVSNCPGETIVPITVAGFNNVGAFSLTLILNSPNLTYTGFRNLNQGLPAGNFTANLSGGKIYLSWFETTGVTLPDMVLVELKFTGTPGNGSLSWDLQTPGNCEYSDAQGNTLYSSWENGNVVVYQPPLILLHPIDQARNTGESAVFSISATGEGLNYRWQLSTNGGVSWSDLSDGGRYSGVTGPYLYISDVPLNWSGYLYRCRVTGTCAPVAWSNAASLTVVPLIITICQTVTSCPGEIIVPITVTDFIGVGAFSMALAFDASILTYTGYQNFNTVLTDGFYTVNESGGKAYVTWFNTTAATIPNGAVLTELKFNGIPGYGNFTWDTETTGNCEYSGITGGIISSSWVDGSININQSPIFTTHPVNKTINSGSNTTFTVSATGGGLNYQWQVSTNNGSNWTNLTNSAPYSGVNSPTLYVNPVSALMNGNLYRCYVTGVCPPYPYSNSAMLTVIQAAITTTIASISNSCTGSLELPIEVSNCLNVGGISLALQFNQANLSFEGFHSIHNELFYGMLAINQTGGKVLLSWASTNPADIGTGILVILRFRANPGTSSTLVWDTQTPGNCEYSDVNGMIISSFYNNATVSVIANALMVSSGNDMATTPGNPLQLNATVSGGFAPYSYLWSPSAGLSNPNILNPIATPVSTTIYTLTVTDNNDCIGTDAMQITVSYNLPQVTTYPISNITFKSATGGGEVLSDGGAPVIARGVCWGAAPSPTITDGHTIDGIGLGAFTSGLTGLTGNTTYYVRAYATNSVGTTYGNEVSFTTLEPPINIAPTINPIPDPAPIYEDAGQQTIYFSGIDDGDPEQDQQITISATSSDLSVIPNPVVNYTPNSSSGSLNYSSLLDAYGNAVITVTVTDDGGTANGGVNMTTTSFNVVVLPVNDPPVANAGADQTATTQQVVVLDGSGSYDVDGDALSYSWTAPPGITLSNPASIHPTFITPFACSNKTYYFGLVVNDGALNSAVDYVAIHVTSALPKISLHPYGFSETLFIGNASNQELTIKNEGVCDLSFSISNPAWWLTIQPGNGTVSPWDSININLRFSAENLSAGTYNSAITVYSNDPVTPTVTIPITFLVLQPLIVQANASPSAICMGGSSQLQATASGGGGSYTYMWFSDPPGFVSSAQNPTVNPQVSTSYMVMVSDGQFTASEFVSVAVYQNQLPGIVENMLPADSVIFQQPSVTFSWQPSANTSLYDLYVWKASDPPSTQPVVSNISGIQYTYNNLNYATTYKWKLISKNPCSQQSESNTQVFIIAELSDLVVSAIQVPLNPSTGQQVEISWNVFNQGNNGTLNAAWYDVAYLSQDMILNPEIDTYLGGKSNLTSLPPNTGYTNSLTINLPEDIFGSLFIIVTADAYGQVNEMNESNNSSFEMININLTPPPDLQVISSIVPTIAFSGETITVQWTTKNLGSGSILNKAWTDRIYLSSQPVFSFQNATYLGEKYFNVNLLPDQSYVGVQQVSLPNYISGTYYIYVYTDANNTVFEHANENNNIFRSTLFEIVLTPPPDLTILDIQNPLTASNGEQITINWTLKNAGASETNASWYDKIFLCPEPAFNAATAIEIGTKQFNIVLQPGETMQNSLQLSAPDKVAGMFYVYGITDYYNQIFEHLNENNNLIRSTSQIEMQHADLAVVSPLVADTVWSGQSLMTNWKIANLGNGTVINKAITDKILLSQSKSFPIVNPVELGTLTYTNLISPGDTLQKNKQVTIPDGFSGKYYLFFWTNSDKNVFENQLLTNNYLADSIIIKLSPYPDLIVDSISQPDTIILGYPYNHQYRAKNVGDTNIFGKTWDDQLFLSSSSILDTTTAFRLKNFQINQLLNVGSTYSTDFQLTLPIWQFQGMSLGYLHGFSDYKKNVFEMQEGNNTKTSPAIRLIIPPKVDLKVTASSTTTDTTQSGRTINFSYSVKNLSTPTNIWEISEWKDAVYLSVDTIWNPGDQMISEWQEIRTLPTDGSYSENRSLTVPHGLSGNYYFLLVTDHTKLNNDLSYINNSRSLTGATPIFIKQTIYPDLKVERFAGPITGNAGQPVKFNWKVSNSGVGPTTANSWTDKIFLSTDFTISPDDVMIASKAIFYTLNVGESYSDSAEVFLPANLSGNYIVIFKTDANNTVYETGQGEINNSSFSGINIYMPLPSDLIVQNISFPATIETGQEMSIQYEIKNIGVNPATGYIKDIIYISSDSTWNFTDPKFGIRDNHVYIAPQMSQSSSVTSQVPGLTPGDYYVLVQTNVLNNIPEVNMGNNTGISATKMTVTVPPLLLGIEKPDVLTDNIARYYEINIGEFQAGETMIVSLQGDSIAGMNELYLNFSSIPSRTEHTFSATEPFKGNQELIVPELQAGKYYLMVYGSTASANTQDITLLADILPFEIRSVHATKGGNNGNVTVMIQGARFENDMVVKLGSNVSSTFYLAQNISFINSTKLFATFDLANSSIGFYDVVAQKSDNTTAILPLGFEIITGSSGNVGVDTTGFSCYIGNIGFADQINTYVQHPSSTRPNWIVTISIHFANNGSVDIAAPGRLLVSLSGVPLSYTPENFTANSKEHYIKFEEFGGPPGILRPGAQGTVTIYTKATVIETLRFVLTQ